MKPHIKRNLFIALVISLIIIVSEIRFLYYSNRPKNLNVILITIDALRPDHLGCYGYKRNTSPNIDKLAKEGVLFTQAITQAPYTAASMAAIFTSTFPDRHGVSEIYEYLDDKNITLAEILQSRGYKTKAITTNFIIAENRGFEQGFNSYKFTEDKPDILTAVEWIERNKNVPFFLWIHLMWPHAPYTPPEPYSKFYLNEEQIKRGKKLRVVNDEYGFKGIPKHVVVEDILNIDYYISQYDGEIKLSDDQVDLLLAKIKQLQFDNKTLVILTADHSEDLGEHDYYFSHGATLYDTVLKVPLIMRYPKLIPKGILINTQVRTIDIMPTILDILGIKKIKEMEGISLLPLILNKKNKIGQSAFSYTQNKVSIRTPRYKLIYDVLNNEYELYNLESDPNELINLAGVEKDQLELLKGKLEKQMIRLKPKKVNLWELLDEETKKRLKALGYLQ